MAQPLDGGWQMRGVDLVPAIELPVLDPEATGLEQLPGPPRKANLHDRVGAAVGDEDTGPPPVVHAEHGARGLDPGFPPEPVVKLGEGAASSMKSVVIGVADPGNPIPVIAGRPGKRQRCAGREHMQPPLRIERVGETEQIPLVRPTTVMENQESFRVPAGRSLRLDQRRHRART